MAPKSHPSPAAAQGLHPTLHQGFGSYIIRFCWRLGCPVLRPPALSHASLASTSHLASRQALSLSLGAGATGGTPEGNRVGHCTPGRGWPQEGRPGEPPGTDYLEPLPWAPTSPGCTVNCRLSAPNCPLLGPQQDPQEPIQVVLSEQERAASNDLENKSVCLEFKSVHKQCFCRKLCVWFQNLRKI